MYYTLPNAIGEPYRLNLCNIMHSMITVEIINLLRVGYNREIEFFQGIYVFGQT